MNFEVKFERFCVWVVFDCGYEFSVGIKVLLVDVDFSIFTKDDVSDIDLHKSGT